MTLQGKVRIERNYSLMYNTRNLAHFFGTTSVCFRLVKIVARLLAVLSVGLGRHMTIHVVTAEPDLNTSFSFSVAVEFESVVRFMFREEEFSAEFFCLAAHFFSWYFLSRNKAKLLALQ